MYIKIDSDPPGPLSTLADLPDAKLAVLEGLNGIGKTLSVRLLQICSGSMPYDTDSPAWKSLCQGLGEFTVTVTGLNGADSVEWEADSRDWRSGPLLGPDAVEFRRIAIDGKTANMEAVRTLLAVERVAGDESLTETLAQEAYNAAETLRLWSRRYASPERGPLATLEREVHRIRTLLPQDARARFVAAEGQIHELGRQLKADREALEAVGDRHRALQAASELATQLAEFKNRAPGLAARLTELDVQIDAAQKNRQSLDAQITALGTKVAMAGPAKAELNNARRTLERNRQKLQHAANVAAAFAGPLGLPTDDAAAAKTAKHEQEQLIADLSRRRTEIDANPAMRGVLETLATRLGEAEERGLGDQVTLEDEAGLYTLTVRETRNGVLARHRRLGDQPPPPEAAEISDRLEGAQRTLSRIRALLDAMDEIQRFRRLVGTNEERVHDALVVADPAAEERMRALDHQRRESDEALLSLAAERAGLQEQLGAAGGASTEESLNEQLADQLLITGGTVETILDDLESAQVELEHLRQTTKVADQQLKETKRDRARVEADTVHATATLSSPEFVWIREILDDDVVPSEQSTLDAQIQSQELLASLLERTAERLGSMREQMAAVVGDLRNRAEHIRGREVQTTLYVDALSNWLGLKFSTWFNLNKVREQLLPEALGQVSVDVEAREVKWQDKTGWRTRPLEAFSSGEQAFAYTRARIGVLDDEPSRPLNRLIVLDEFGAFISHDRMNQLLSYLRDRIKDNPDDQVLVILPLSRDYDELAASAVGQEGERMSDLARQIATRKYAVRVLS